MQFGHLRIDPAKNPAILDTATWNPDRAWATTRALDESYWDSVLHAAKSGETPPSAPGFTPHFGSHGRFEASSYFLSSLADGQQIFIGLENGRSRSPLGEPIGSSPLSNATTLRAYGSNAETIARYHQYIRPDKGPKALGAMPRLGIGVRMSLSVWPGVWPAMDRKRFAANAIQNSLRELNLLDDVLAGRPAHSNYLFSFGSIEEGHTGSTFEGLWVAGALEALKSETQPVFGADADHIQVKRGPGGLERAKRVIEAARHYTFFTLDVSDILDYAALTQRERAAGYLDNLLRDEERKSILQYHRERRRIAGEDVALGETEIGCLAGKHWHALNALEELHRHLLSVKGDTPLDLELSIDETPPEVQVCSATTTETELIFLLLEVRRRGIPLTHVAPNFGVEKGVDYRCPDGLPGLEKRVARLHRIASEAGIMLDCHSGDDLTQETRRVFGRATGGQIHFKISPMLQTLFADRLYELQPEAFYAWWTATKEYAESKAQTGSDFARACLEEVKGYGPAEASPKDRIFHYYHFAPVGLRDAEGQFRHRELFYTLSQEFYDDYASRVQALLEQVAEDVLDPGALVC